MTPQPDFLRPLRGPHRLAWVACATALAVLGVAALDAHDAWQQLTLQPPSRPSRPPSPPPTATAAGADTVRSLQQATARLQRPWPTAMAALDAVRPAGVHWLALEIGDSGGLRLQGQASGGHTAQPAKAAIAAAEALRHLGAWQEPVLGRMDADDSGWLRFEITAEAKR